MKKRFLAFILSFLLILPVLPLTAFAEDGGYTDGWYSVFFSKAEGDVSGAWGGSEVTLPEEEQYADTDIVRVSIVLADEPTLFRYASRGVAQNKSAMNYRENLKIKQEKLARKISAEALGGEELDVVWYLTLTANIVTANVAYGQIAKIKKVAGVVDVMIEQRHEPETTVEAEAAEPTQTTGTVMTNTRQVWTAGYTGAGSAVAVIDTGINVDHLSFDAGAFEYALGTLGKTVDSITRADVEAVFDQLNVKINNPDLTVDDVYVNSKIPFGYNYVDKNTDVTHLNDKEGDHGSHVAGIAAANRYVPDGNGGYAEALPTVKTQGQAPDAQLFAMKVFGKKGGAFEGDYFAAIEDAILLGADAANLSLGSASPGHSYNPEFNELLQRLVNCDTVVSISMGNNSYWPKETARGLLYAEDKSLYTGGDPGSCYNVLTVASVDNISKATTAIEVFGRKIAVGEPGDSNAPIVTLKGRELDFIAIDGYGTDEDFAALADVLPGKVAICSRGENSFFEKANAAVENGAIAVVIYNNTEGDVSMNISGYKYTAPVVSILQTDGEFIKANAVKVYDPATGALRYYTGKMTVPSAIEFFTGDSSYYTMSGFSSWGIPGSLILKPEITAPGGSIYSVTGGFQNDLGTIVGPNNDAYGLKSGTSMAAPQVAGITALLAEYIRDNDLTTKTGLSMRHLTTALMMGTAVPVIEKESDNYYSVLSQGAGLVNANAALNTHTYLMMHEDATAAYNDYKIKAELGEVSRSSKSFSFTFDVNNFGLVETEYLLGADFFTQDYCEMAACDLDLEPIYDENGNEVTRLYMSLQTASLSADVVWAVDGKVITSENAAKYDFNGDGSFTRDDVQTLLDYTVGKVDAISCEENADVNGDGEIGTYDAYLALDALKCSEFTVPAGDYATVSVTVTLLDIDDYDYNGAYIEGYVFVTEQNEGGEDVVSSIPVLGYYGSWSEPSMFDHGTVLEAFNGGVGTTPYMVVVDGAAAARHNGFAVTYGFKQGVYYADGNPLIHDSVPMPQRSAIKSDTEISYVLFTLIRNTQATELVITDEAGNELFKTDYGRKYSAFYNPKNKTWNATNVTQFVGYKPDGLAEGTKITATLRTVPEYYGVDGNIDWDALAEGTRFSQTFVVDNTCPEILSVDVHYSADKGGFDAVKVTAKDDQYVAYAKLSDENGEDLTFAGADQDVDLAPGQIYEQTLDLCECFADLSDVPDHMTLTVGDYAYNFSEYYLNLNPKELKQDVRIEINRDVLSLAPQMTSKLSAVITPWGKQSEVLWSSSDDSVATVESDGTVTAAAPGNAVITATPKANPDKSATVAVEVKIPNIALSAMLEDEYSDTWQVSFDTATVPAYVKGSAQPFTESFETLCYDENGVLYTSVFDTTNEKSVLYTLNEQTLEPTLIAASDGDFIDLAPAPALSAETGKKLLIGVSGAQVLWIDAETALLFEALDYQSLLGEAFFAGIAYAGVSIDETSGDPVDEYYLVSSTGLLYKLGYSADAAQEIVESESPERISKYEASANAIFSHSLYLTVDGKLVWAVTENDKDHAEVVYFDVSDETEVRSCKLGEFDSDVCPVGGLCEPGQSLAFDYQTKVAALKSAATAEVGIPTEAFDAPAAPAELSAPTAPPAPAKQAQNPIDLNAATIEITADEETTNGLYVVYYDPAVYELRSVECHAEMYAINEQDGVVVIAMAGQQKIPADEVIATVGLYTVGTGSKTVSVVTEERNDEYPGTVAYLFDLVHIVGSIGSMGDGKVTLEIYSLSGELVKSEEVGNGLYSVYLPAEEFVFVFEKEDHARLELIVDATVDPVFDAKLRHICDVNNSGSVDISDATALLDCLAGGADCDVDPDGDGKLTISDVTKVLNVLAGN